MSTIIELDTVIDLGSAVIADGDSERGMKPRVALLLEDEALISMDVEATLIDSGFEVHCAMTCEEAHDWLEIHTPDVAIVDIVLRDGRCTEVVARLLQAGIPVIVHTGEHRSAHIGTPFELGAWLTKPCTPNALVYAVRAAGRPV